MKTFYLKEYSCNKELVGRLKVKAPSKEVAINKLESAYAGNVYKECSGDTLGGIISFRSVEVIKR